MSPKKKKLLSVRFSGSCENSDSYLSDKKPWKNKNPVKCHHAFECYCCHRILDIIIPDLVYLGSKSQVAILKKPFS